MIASLLDTDFYKFTMAQAVWALYPNAWVRYRYVCRGGTDVPPGKEKAFSRDLANAVRALCGLSMEKQELSYLESLGFFSPGFLEALRLLQLNPEYINWSLDSGKGLEITIEGPWFSTIWFEVPVLAIVSELHTIHASEGQPDFKQARERLNKKIKAIRSHDKPLTIVDFGTRRRASFSWQKELLSKLIQEAPKAFSGTSNVHLARTLDLPPVGTMAHEWLQAHQQLVPLRQSQKAALLSWARLYRGKLGIALSDVLGMDAFLNDFDGFYARLYDGCRHDSGDPVQWGEKLIGHYEKLGLDPATKTAVFSDALTVDRMLKLNDYFSGGIRLAYGIGTHLTNDTGQKPPDIVIKMAALNHGPVAKISDTPGKGMYEEKKFARHLCAVFDIPESRLR